MNIERYHQVYPTRETTPPFPEEQQMSYHTTFQHPEHFLPTPERSSSGLVTEVESLYEAPSDSDSDYESKRRPIKIKAEKVKYHDKDYEHLKNLPRRFCPFEESRHMNSMFDSNDIPVEGDVHAEFDKTFLYDSAARHPYYTAYRRNYFAVQVRYQLRFDESSTSTKDPLFVHDGPDRLRVKHLIVRIKAVRDDFDGEELEIVRYNAQRHVLDPTEAPLKHKMQPCMPDHEHAFNESTKFKKNKAQYPTNHTFVRLQFRKATENNGQRRKDQRYHRVMAELCAVFNRSNGEECFAVIEQTISGLIVVHGRGPSSHEVPDPNNRRRRPRKASSARCNRVGTRPTGITKRSGPPRKSEIARQVADFERSMRPRRRHVVSHVLSTTDHIKSDIDINGSSEVLAPFMIPTNDIPPNMLLPDPREEDGGAPADFKIPPEEF